MKNHIPANRMEFVIGDSYNSNSVKDSNAFYLTKDGSLMYNSTTACDYSILLGGNWRFELMVDSFTGLCAYFQSFLDELKVSHKSLILPKSKPKKVFVKSDEELCYGEGCHYQPFLNQTYWDESKKILCIGNPDISGEAIEFAPHTTMVIKKSQLVCLYLNLNNISNINFF